MTGSGSRTALAPAAAREEAAYEELAAGFREVFGRIAAGAVERDQLRTLPFEQMRWLNQSGFGAVRVPRERGGPGVSLEHLFRLLMELAEADSNVAHIYRTHFSFVEGLPQLGSQWQDRWYPRVLAGEVFGNASTEASGNAMGTTATKLRRTDEGWVVNGRKYYSTGSIFADWITVTTTIEGQPGRQFGIVRATDPGVELLDDWNGFGQPLTGTGTTIFTDAKVAPQDVIPRVDGPSDGPAFVQLVLLAVLAGIGRAALAQVRTLVRERTRVFNTGSGVLFREDPQILQIVGEISAKVHTAQALVRSAARDFDIADDPASCESSQARYLRRELAVEQAHIMVPDLIQSATQKIFDAGGASATAREKGLDRHWRNARTIATHNPAVFKARIVGDYQVNGTLPVGLWGIGELTPEKDVTQELPLEPPDRAG